MPNNHSSFILKGRCQRCGKFIEIELSVEFQDRTEFGEAISYQPEEMIPGYLKTHLRQIQDSFDSHNSMWKNQPTSSKPSGNPPYINPEAPICKNCAIVEKLKA